MNSLGFSAAKISASICCGIVGLAIIGGGVSGCRIIVPTPEEQAHLAAQGAFAGQRPGWLSTDVRTSDTPTELIPETFGSRPEVRGQLASDQIAYQERKALEAEYSASGKADQVPAALKSSSPLDRINASCPGIESEVNAALTTTELGSRIAKYLNLTAKCSTSPDLWVWLGNDYLRSGELPLAKRAFDQALVADPTNTDALRGNEEVNRQLNAPNELSSDR